MKPPKELSKRGRDLLWVCGVSLLALVPVLVLWRKSVSTQNTAFLPAPQPKPVWRAGAPSNAPAQLSSDGQFFAAMDNAKGQSNAFAPSDLVICTQRGQEVFRSSQSDTQFRWFGTSLVSLEQTAGFATIFSPASGTGAPFTSTQRNFASSRSGQAYGSGKQLFLSEDGSLLAQARWEGASIVWSVVDMATGQFLADGVSAGVVTKGVFSNNASPEDLSFAVAPATTKWPRGVKGPVVAVAQRMAFPVVTPTPTPIPQPTPTLSPAQIEFSKRETKENKAIEDLVDTVMGVDGEAPQVTDEARVAQIEAEVKQRSAALRTEHNRLFPLAFPAATPLSLATEARACRVSCFDLGTGRALWKTTVRTRGSLAPRLLFSPDGTRVLLSGLARVTANPNPQVSNCGIDVLAPVTGRVLAKWTIGLNDLSFHARPPIYFLSGSPSTIAVINDKVRFFNQSTLRESSYLMLRGSISMQEPSPDAGGNLWISQQNSDVFVMRRSDLGEEYSGPLPTPTSPALFPAVAG